MSFRVKLRLKTIKNQWFPRLGPLGPFLAAPDIAPPTSCKVCGMSFTDAMGRPIAMAYACPNIRCPSKAVCISTSSFQFSPQTAMLWNGLRQ